MKTITLAAFEFIRRFLIHVLPSRFHRIRHYGLFANGQRRDAISRTRALLDAAKPPVSETESRVDKEAEARNAAAPAHRCPCCGGRMIVIETFAAGTAPHRRPSAPIFAIRIDTS